MGTLLEFKKIVYPAISRAELLDMFFDKKKRDAIYKKFDEKSLEPNEDNYVDIMKKRIHLEE